MRVHTKLTRNDLYLAAGLARVDFHRLTTHGSRSHHHAFDLILTGSAGRRGQAGDYEAASWDEWGIFLAKIFELDPDAKAAHYSDADRFHYMTDGRYRTLKHRDQHRNHKWEWNGGASSVCKKCGAARRYT